MGAFGRGRQTRHGRSHSELICERDGQTDAWKTQRSDSTAKREIGSWGATRKRTIYGDVKNDASLKQLRRDGDAGTHSNDLHKQGVRDGNKDTDGWGASIENLRSNPWEPNRDANVNKETSGWGSLEPDDRTKEADAWSPPENDLQKQGIRDGNKKTDGWGASIDKLSSNPWGPNRDADVNKKTDGWGAAIDLGHSVGWGRHNNVGNAERVADGWNKSDGDANANANAWGASELNDRDYIANKKTNSDDPWEHRSYDDTVTKKTDGWGTAINPGHSSAWGRQNNNDNAEREADGWNRNNGPRPPIGIKSATNSWDNRESVGVCRNFIAGRCTRGSQCRYLHDDNKKARGVCYQFEKGRCHRGSACCYVHHENIDCRTHRSQGWNKNSSWNAPKSLDTSNKNSSRNGPKWADVATGTEPFGLVEMRVDLIETPNKADVTNDTEPPELMETINAPSGSATNPIDLEEGHQLRILKSSTAALSVTGHADENPTKNPEPVKAKQTGTGEVSGAVRRFKFALVDYVKEKLKPSWDDGDFSKDIHKVIVKKVVDKVIGALQGSNIPRTQDHIDIYLSFAEAKLNDLIQAYLKKYTGKAIKFV